MRFDPVECGKRIKALREEKRLTQMELAEQICITTDHLRAIERGRRACSIDLLVDLSLFFEVTILASIFMPLADAELLPSSPGVQPSGIEPKMFIERICGSVSAS